MMFNINDWLQEPVTRHAPYEPPQEIQRHRLLSFLLLANGGFDIHGWGCISNGGANGHQQGLEQDDALTLIEFRAFLAGLRSAGIDWEEAFRPYWDQYRAEFGA